MKTSHNIMPVDLAVSTQAGAKDNRMELRLENILESMGDAFVSLDKDWRYRFVNKKAAGLLGKSAASLAGKKIWDVFPDIKGTIFETTYRQVLKTGVPASFEIYYESYKMWLDVRAFAHDGGISIFYTDITLRKQAEAKLEMNERRFKALVENSADAIAIVTPAGDPVYVSPSIKNVLGYEEAEAMRLNMFSLLHPDERHLVDQVMKQVMSNAGGTFRTSYVRVWHKDRTWHWLDGIMKNCMEDPGINGIVINFRDVSEKMDAELKTRMHDQEITRAIINTQEHERYNLGIELHDNINQILAGTLITLGVAKTNAQGILTAYIEQSREYIHMAIEEIRKLSHRLAPASFDNETFKDAVENLLEGFNVDNKFNVRLHFNSEPDCPINSAVQLNLYRILQEQLNNIQKYSGADTIEINVVNTIPRVVLRIYDNGKGFDKGKARKGIGLRNIQKRTESFSGVFNLETSPGNGCELVIDIPH